MSTRYALTKRLTDDIVVLLSAYGQQMWTRVRLRKHTTCAMCRADLDARTTAFSPIGFGQNRMHRICVACVQTMTT